MKTWDMSEYIPGTSGPQKLSLGLRFGPGIMKNGQNDPAVKKSVLACSIVKRVFSNALLIK